MNRARGDDNYGPRCSAECLETTPVEVEYAGYPGYVSYRSYGVFDSYFYTDGIAREFDLHLRGSLSGLKTQSCMSGFEFLSRLEPKIWLFYVWHCAASGCGSC